MSVMTITLDDRSFVGNRKALSDLQTDFADRASERHGQRRGLKHFRVRHERVRRVYGHMNDNCTVELPERLTASLELAGMVKDVNKALKAYGKWEAQVEAGDLKALKEATGSRAHIERIADICDRVFSEPER